MVPEYAALVCAVSGIATASVGFHDTLLPPAVEFAYVYAVSAAPALAPGEPAEPAVMVGEPGALVPVVAPGVYVTPALVIAVLPVAVKPVVEYTLAVQPAAEPRASVTVTVPIAPVTVPPGAV